MFCSECGAQIADGSNFCNVCGAKIEIPQQNDEYPEYMPQFDSNVQLPNQNQSQPEDKDKKKLPVWAKICIAVFILAVAGISTFLTIHFLKGKKNKDASITINGTKCEINAEYGISNIDKAGKGFVYRDRTSVTEYTDEVYIDGVLAEDADPKDYDIVIEKNGSNIVSSDRKIACISIDLYNFADYKMGDGTSRFSSTKELEKAGYIFDGMCLYSKYFDKDGEIPLSRVNSDYEKFLSGGSMALDYSLGNAFPDVMFGRVSFRGTKEENKKELIECYKDIGYNSNNWDNLIKSRLIYSSEAAKLSGIRRHNDNEWAYDGSTSDFLVRVDYFYYGGNYNFLGITIYAPIEKLNEYMTKWGLPESALFKSGSSGTSTETADEVTEAAEPATEAAEPATEAASEKDNGGSFLIVNGVLSVDNNLFGKSYDELNEYFGYTLPALIYWEYSDVPLYYFDYTYSDGNNYVLFFENNILVAVRYESVITENVIPQDLYDKAVGKFGNHDFYWYYSDTMQTFEYDWDYKINSKTGEYAIFLNPYDGINHIDQQYTSADYSGESIQNH